MIIQNGVGAFISGIHNLLPDEEIPADAASDSLNWRTKDGHIELAGGRQTIGGTGAAGKSYAEHTAFRADGTAVRYRKVDGAIQYFNGTAWVNVITGLTVTADYTCSNYQSLAGAFVYFFGVDGIFKICTANPTDYVSLYDSTKNFKGYGFIDLARTILWGRKEDPTGLYGSYIDGQNSTVYTTVSGESIGISGSTTYPGTLAFKAVDAKRTCFGIQISASTAAGTETFTDDVNGVLTSNFGGTGTINYTTGAYSVTFANTTTGAVTASYQWENSNSKGVTDFTKSATRLAGEGFIERQDAGGDAIILVIPLGGSYFSIKKHSCYKFTLDSTDENPTNEIFRTNIGVQSLRSAVGTSEGIVIINTGNPSKPVLTIIKQNQVGDNFDTAQLFPQFAFENYTYDDALIDYWDRYIILACKEDSNENNRLLLCDFVSKRSVDVTYYGIRTATKVNGVLYGGDPVSQSTYELFTGTDDNGTAITNYWIGNGETLGDLRMRQRSLRNIRDTLKKFKRLRLKGLIDPNQWYEVYISFDDGDFTLVGTVRGSGDYVDYGVSYAMGTETVGSVNVGGGSAVAIYPYFMEIKLHCPKFRKRKLKFVAKGIGFVSVAQTFDIDYWLYQDALPSRYRTKQNVSLDGLTTDLDVPQN